MYSNQNIILGIGAVIFVIGTVLVIISLMNTPNAESKQVRKRRNKTSELYPFLPDMGLHKSVEPKKDGWLKLTGSDGREIMLSVSFALSGITDEEIVQAKFFFPDGSTGTLSTLITQIVQKRTDYYCKKFFGEKDDEFFLPLSEEICFQDTLVKSLKLYCPEMENRNMEVIRCHFFFCKTGTFAKM